MYEPEWDNLGLDMQEERFSTCRFLLFTCVRGMRGYEAVSANLATLRYERACCEALDDYALVSWPIVWRLKYSHEVVGCYMVPVDGVTHSVIPFFQWVQRFVCTLASLGRGGLAASALWRHGTGQISSRN